MQFILFILLFPGFICIPRLQADFPGGFQGSPPDTMIAVSQKAGHALDMIEHPKNISGSDSIRCDTSSEKSGMRNLEMKKIQKAVDQSITENWPKERWRMAVRNDHGLGYRTTGGILGFNLGAAAGMLIGKTFQEQKVTGWAYHPGDWWSGGSWTELFYTYENKHAPYWGAAIGAVTGALAGYYLGKSADKNFYMSVPGAIRMEKTRLLNNWDFIIGFGVVGPIIGSISGLSLYAPDSGHADKTDLGPDEFLFSYFIGAISGTIMVAAFRDRIKHRQLWEKSLIQEQNASFNSVRIIPLDVSSFTIYKRTLANSESFFEYQLDLLRVRF